MSEATSSPSVHLHAISPSSSMSSADSAPLSEPTSDEQPDLGAFNAILREFTHLQPNTRIPVQIRPATSSTTSTFPPGQSVAGSDLHSRSIRSRTSRISSRGSVSTLSSFTRPPSSSCYPEGSTVWTQFPIALYLNQSQAPTPVSEEDNSFLDQGELGYAYHSPASTEGGRTVEIADSDFLSFEDGSYTSNHPDSSPHPSLAESDMPVSVSLNYANPRLDSRETERPEEDFMVGITTDEDNSSLTSRDIFHPVQPGRSSVTASLGFQTHSSDSHSRLTSMQLQSQARPATTSSNFSLPLPATSQSSHPSPLSLPTLDDSAFSNFPARSRNPVPPRTVSDSSYTAASASSSNVSLLSYQIPDTPPIPISVLDESDRGPVTVTTQSIFRLPTDQSSVTTSSSSDSNLNSISLKTQGSFAYSLSTASASNSTATYHAQSHSHSVFLPTDDNSVSQPSIATNSSTESPFRDPQSPMPTPEPEAEELNRRMDVGASRDRPNPHPSMRHRETVADYLRTPDQPPSESFPHDSPGSRQLSFRPLDDEEYDERAAATAGLSQNSRFPATDRTTSSTFHPSNYDHLRSEWGHSLNLSMHTRSQPQSSSFSTREINDEDYDDDHSYRFPHSHTPRTHTQAHTPKGTGSSESTQAKFQPAVASVALHNSRSDHNGQQQSTSQPLPPSTHMSPSLTQPSRTHQLQAQQTTRPNHRSSQIHPLLTNPQPEKKVTRVQPFHPPAQLGRGHNYGAGYPHSLLGLHALPASLISPDPGELPSILDASSGDGASSNSAVTMLTTHVARETHAAAGDLFAVPDHLPSLGFLDEALSFIASERARLDAAQKVSVAFTTNGGDSGGNVGGGVEGEVDRKQSLDTDTPKRKRRRKRPVRAHSSTRGAGDPVDPSIIADDIKDHAQTPESSPKKKRSKSASASLSSSLLSLPLNQELPSKGRTRSKGKEKAFLIAPPSLEDGDGKPLVTILKRRVETQGHHIFSEDDSDQDDGIATPTNAGVSRKQVPGEPISLGKKGKRDERRGREREKPTRDAQRESVEGVESQPLAGGVVVPESEFGTQYADHNDDEDDDDGADPQEEDEPRDGLSGFSLLQPPPRRTDRGHRRKARETAHIHVTSSIGGVYKSTPGTPKRQGLDLDEDEHEGVSGPRSAEAEDAIESTPSKGGSSSNPSEKRRRSRPKKIKALKDKKPITQLGADTQLDGGATLPVDERDVVQKLTIKEYEGKDILDMDRTQFQQVLEAPSTSGLGLLSLSKPAQTQSQPTPQSKRGRMITLAKRLHELFPEQREELGRIITRFEKQGIRPTKGKKSLVVDGLDLGQSSIAPIATPGAKKKRSRKRGHVRTGSEGTGGEAVEVEDDLPSSLKAGLRVYMRELGDLDEEGEDDEEEELDPRGRPPRKNDILIHVFIDHSNILIGLLSYLKRNPPPQNNSPRTKPLAAVLTKTTTTVGISPTSAFAAVKSTTARPLPVPGLGSGNGPGPPANRPQAVPIPSASKPPIPLPSFAMLSRSLPAGPVLSTYNGENVKNTESDDDGQRNKDKAANSDGYEHPDEKSKGAGLGQHLLFAGGPKYRKGKAMKPARHLWHAALALILERGRPVTRRVVVTSSPLYQPMESIEHLGYELRVFIRVPDLGDGMDREKRSGKSSTAGKGSQPSPVTSVSFSGLPVPQKHKSFGHARHLSESTSTESGSGSAGGSNPHPYHGITTSSAPPAKIKYREQGVDELLQLKLHQALAATDEVPDGSTIVLATGDGNMGQFNEEGFLGPVRTALKRGWKVELYAWEDGLSRAWRREFGETSEWGRKGMFRVIAMEQFANWLVESPNW